MASAVPEISRVWSLVNSSLLLLPLSVEMLATTGAFGAVISTTTLKVLDVFDVLPAPSVASAVTLYVPSDKVVPLWS